VKFKHFLITRFNCPIGYAQENIGIMDAWLTKRFALFERFCLPSVRTQSTKDFTWLLLLDKRTPRPWLSRLTRNVAELSSPVIVLTLTRYSERRIREQIQKLASNVDVIITTRLDNDDAIARTFLGKVVEICRKLTHDRHYVINFRYGCQIHKSGLYLFAPSYLNPFISLLSPVSNLRTVYHAGHQDMGAVGTVINIGSGEEENAEIMWMQVLHSSNVSNRLRNGSDKRRIGEENIVGFAIDGNLKSL
jgi:hypothetical protein